MLSRLTDHYLQIIANCAPIGFEAEFVGQRGYNTLYRGILMPLSSDGEAIDFIYGVINWKEMADSGDRRAASLAEVDRAIAAAPRRPPTPGLGGRAQCRFVAPRPARRRRADDETLSLWPEERRARRPARRRPATAPTQAARRDQRSRAALYRALGHAHDFALAAEDAQDGYAELLDDAGLEAQRARR